ncbi:MAG: DUF1015 domain-containing protein [Clostridia bacterium]
MNIVKIPEILLPKKAVDLEKWAVVACDQFTSQPDYWEQLQKFTKGAPSAFNLIFPEVYLNEDNDKRIESINTCMRKYLNDGIFDTIRDSFILVERDTMYAKCRLGLILAVDLESYDYTPFSNAYIKATEGTIIERIPPRVKIRSNAPLELPHIMLLIDDTACDIIEPIYENRQSLEVLYDTKLNMKGGHIKGYKVSNPNEIIKKLYALLDEKIQKEKYNTVTNFLFAVGDGNHSLATAKAHWDSIKAELSEADKTNHPARFALVEVMNLHSKALVFEPIHRVIFNGGDQFISDILNYCKGAGKMKLLYNGSEIILPVSENKIEAIKQVQDFIDQYIKCNPSVKVDYVHGIDDLNEVCNAENGIGLVMPTIDKCELFDYIIRKGVLPRKSFSMGEAVEKRYYLEAKKIIKY